MIKVEHVSFTYAGKKTVYTDLSFSTVDGRMNCIIGKNGVGKSTIFDMISGLVDPQAGTIDPLLSSAEIIYQMQGVPMLPAMTGQNILDIFRDLNPGTQRTDEFLTAVYQENVVALLNEKYRDMSGGERRLLIIYAMCTLKRALYLFDEPTSGLDPISARKILGLLSDLATCSQVIFTGHNLFELQNVPCHVIFIANQHCIFQGNYEELMARYSENDPVQTFVDALKADQIVS
ncbi:ATP-binding cassette domain-containing protein [Levilactobacillus enshiensis]|uniref:ATP-binding cassette domain-containing protein n=1 Tax=Levilactobacillus enshiensis TaxID=2590213 RepID=UPI001179EA48|nr:ABC transporter ATP-binding protein [Levilactobacillus enshiensis]